MVSLCVSVLCTSKLEKETIAFDEGFILVMLDACTVNYYTCITN